MFLKLVQQMKAAWEQQRAVEMEDPVGVQGLACRNVPIKRGEHIDDVRLAAI